MTSEGSRKSTREATRTHTAKAFAETIKHYLTQNSHRRGKWYDIIV